MYRINKSIITYHNFDRSSHCDWYYSVPTLPLSNKWDMMKDDRAASPLNLFPHLSHDKNKHPQTSEAEAEISKEFTSICSANREGEIPFAVLCLSSRLSFTLNDEECFFFFWKTEVDSREVYGRITELF